MRIFTVSSAYTYNGKNQNRPVFKRAPRGDVKVPWSDRSEVEEYPKAIEDAKKFLGIKNLALILHQSSFPVKDRDVFIGSHINDKSLELNKFLKFHGFDSIQLGPPGLTQLSPYQSSINSKNYLYTDLEKFSTPEYANLLTINDITGEIKNVDKDAKYENNSDLTNFNKAFYVVDKLYQKAYKNLAQKVKNGDPAALKLNAEFQQFVKKQDGWLEKDSVFVLLRNLLRMDDNFFEWPDMCRNLFDYKEDKESPFHDEAVDYYKHLNRKYKKELDIYKFKQFVIDKQEHEFQKVNGKLPYSTDAIIGFHMMDYYAHKDAFLPGYRVGTPYGGEGRAVGNGSPWGNNQTWDIPVVNPKKLFVKDDAGNIIGLGPAGKLIRQKFEKLLDTYENLRIDHVIGLIDPWIYDKNKVEVKIGRYPNEDPNVPEHVIYRNAHGANISMMHKDHVFGYDKGWDHYITDQINEDIKNMPDIDPDGDYAKILDEILLPLFQEKGVNPADMAWETLGCDTPKFREIFDKNRNGHVLPEITSAYEWQIQKRMADPRHKEDTVILGCHDHPPFAQVCDDNFYAQKNCPNGIFQDTYIVGSLYPEKTNEQRAKLMSDLKWDRRSRVKIKFQEMFRFGQKIQLTFMDFFGLDKTYNNAGTQNPNNWKLRLKKSYKEDYYKALEWRPGDAGVNKVALNMPEELKRPVISKIVCDGDKIDNHRDLIDRLSYFENVLKTPDENQRPVGN